MLAVGSPAVQAQKLADAPSTVMLAKNIQQQTAEASPVAPHAAAMAGRYVERDAAGNGIEQDDDGGTCHVDSSAS